MQNTTQDTLPTWIFFSNVDAITVNNSASQLLAWSGESFGRLFDRTQNLLNVLLDGDHRLAKEHVIELIALLGACVASNPTAHPSVRELLNLIPEPLIKFGKQRLIKA